MFAAKQFTIRSLMLVTAYAAALPIVSAGNYLYVDCTIIGVWLVPVALAAVIRRRSTLAVTCMALNLLLYALARTCLFATWKKPGCEAFCDAAGALFLGAFYPAAAIFNHGDCPEWREGVVFIVLAASVLYALVGVGFSHCFTPRQPRSAAQDRPGPEGTERKNENAKTGQNDI